MSTLSPPKLLNVHLLPELADPHEMAGHMVVVIDVLRASTTLSAAIAAGASQVVPCLEVGEARQLARQRSGDEPALLGGERHGERIEGFDLGNSPMEYVAERVAGRTIVFTTTNGTRAMMRCVGAGRVLFGSFVNLSALIARLADEARVEVICAGTDRQISWEDTLLAGAIVDRLAGPEWQMNDAAQIACRAWRQIGGRSISHFDLTAELSSGRGGQNLIDIDRADDIAFAASQDAVGVVPELNLADWAIRR